MNISNKIKHKYSDLFGVLKKRDKSWSDKIVKYSIDMDEPALLRLACKCKAKVLRTEKYLHERSQRE